jgi:hypothetical protein
MPGFFDSPVNSYALNPEPPEKTVLRDLLTRKDISMQADPFGGNQMRSNSLNPAPAFTGSAGGPSDNFFYGDQATPGQGPDQGPSQGQRPTPILALLQHLTRTLGPRPTGAGASGPGATNTMGSFFDRMKAANPNRDSRSGLQQLLQRLQSRPLGNTAYDGPMDPSQANQGIMQWLNQRQLAGGRGSMPQMDPQQMQQWLQPLGMSWNPGSNGYGTFTGPNGSYTSHGGSHEGAGPGGQSAWLQKQFFGGSGADDTQNRTQYGNVQGLDAMMGGFAGQQYRNYSKTPEAMNNQAAILGQAQAARDSRPALTPEQIAAKKANVTSQYNALHPAQSVKPVAPPSEPPNQLPGVATYQGKPTGTPLPPAPRTPQQVTR